MGQRRSLEGSPASDERRVWGADVIAADDPLLSLRMSHGEPIGRQMKLFREHRVYGKAGARSVLYVCLEDLQTGRFTVQQAEYFDRDETSERAAQIASLTLELFAEKSRDTAIWSTSLLEAIAAHNAYFGDFFDGT